MKAPSTKKLFYFSRYDVVDKWLKDTSIQTGKTESAVAEDVLLGRQPGMTTISAQAQFIVSQWYAEDNATTAMINSAIAYAATYVPCRPDSYVPQRELALVQLTTQMLCTINDSISECADINQVTYNINTLHSVYEALVYDHSKLSGDEALRLQLELKHCHDIIQILDSTPDWVQWHTLTRIVETTWEYCRYYPATYRLLCGILDTVSIPNTPTTRLATLESIRLASADWPA